MTKVRSKPFGPALRARYTRFAESLYPTATLDADERRVARTSVAASIILVLVVSTLALIEFAFRGASIADRWMIPTSAIAFAMVPIVMRLSNARWGGWWLVGIGLTLITLDSLLDAGMYSDGMIWLPGVPLVAAIIIGSNSSVAFGVLASIAALIVYSFGPQPFASATQHTLRFVTTLMVTGFVAALIRVYERNMETRSAELADALRRLDGIVGSMPHDLIRLDASGLVRDHVLKGSVHVQKTSAVLADYLPPELVASVNNLRSQFTDDVTPRAAVVAVGNRSFELQAVPLGGDESLVLLQEITARKDLEATKADFVSVVSHELRTPLTAIVGALGLVLGGVRGEIADDARNSITMASRNAGQLKRLIDDLLDLRKLEAGEMTFQVETVHAAELTEAARQSLMGYADSHHVELVVQATPDRYVMADRHRVLQVLANLMSNAIKFTGDNKRVELSTELVGRDVVFRVIDHGDGISEDFRGLVFQKFSQAQRDQPGAKGTGLGLAIAHQIVTRLGGTIGFDTEVGVGTTFWFALPEARRHDSVATTQIAA